MKFFRQNYKNKEAYLMDYGFLYKKIRLPEYHFSISLMAALSFFCFLR
jgi:hypothetical protein